MQTFVVGSIYEENTKFKKGSCCCWVLVVFLGFCPQIISTDLSVFSKELREVHFRSKKFLFDHFFGNQTIQTDIHIALACSSDDGCFPRCIWEARPFIRKGSIFEISQLFLTYLLLYAAFRIARKENKLISFWFEHTNLNLTCNAKNENSFSG